jgi:hypothetical protein
MMKMYLQKVISGKSKKNVGVLKVNDENSRIRIRINLSEARISGSGSGCTPKCHGSATLVVTLVDSDLNPLAHSRPGFHDYPNLDDYPRLD